MPMSPQSPAPQIPESEASPDEMRGTTAIPREATGPSELRERVHQSEERYRALFESIDEGFCIIEMVFGEDGAPLDYRFLETNPAFERHTGLEHAVGRTVREMVPGHDAHWFEIYGRVAMTGDPVRFEDRAEAMGRWFDVYAFRVGQPHNRQVAILFTDVTKHREAQDALRRNQAQLEAVFEAVRDGISLWDMEGNLLLANESLARINGYDSAREMLRDLDYFGGVYELREGARPLPPAEWPISRVLRGESLVDWELSGRRRDTGRAWDFSYSGGPVFDAQGRQTLAVVITRDITARKQAERERAGALQALAGSEATLRSFFESAPLLMGVVEVTGDDILHLSVNAQTEHFFGLDPGTLAGRSSRELGVPADLIALWLRHYRRAEETGAPARFEYQHTAASGTLWLAAVVSFIERTHEGRARCAYAVEDVTERKRAEEERDALLARQTRVAETLQRSLLLMPPPDAFPGISIKTLYQSASDEAKVGGDFHDAFALPDGRVALVAGDVTGKGLEAATYTAEVKFVLRAFLREAPSPANALERLSHLIHGERRVGSDLRGSNYVVAAVALVDTRTGEVTYSTAGMEPPFLLRPATGEVLEMGAGGPLLGAQEGAPYEMQRERMWPGDLLVMATDGLTEARQGRRFFGYDGLVGAVRESAHLGSLADIAQAVARRAQDFAGGTLTDDVCLLLARRNGAREDVPDAGRGGPG